MRSGEIRFPTRDRFAAVMFEQARNLGAGGFAKRRYSLSEEDSITFLYESARNSFEHARVDGAGMPIQGVRGILVEKLVFGSQAEMAARKDIADFQKQYLTRIWNTLSPAKRVITYSVVDLGPGIQWTLPSANASESPMARLERAFRPGQTRKSHGLDMEAGMGLSKLYAAARRVRALLIVRSAELTCVLDFSQSATSSEIGLRELPGTPSCGSIGTALTLLWPDIEGAGDQGRLF
jgi:hypothetical protein